MADMRTEEIEGVTWVDCSGCGQMFPIEEWMLEMCENDAFRRCEVCAAKAEAEERRREDAERLERLADAAGIPELYRLDRQTRKPMISPPVPHVARWMWEHRAANLLLSGRTGVGKSTSAVFCAMRMLAEGKKVRYCKLRRFFSEWRDARTSDDPAGDERFFADIRRLDLLILDEAADKVKITESAQEVMYELLDQIADGELRTRLWLLGNFRAGAVDELFGDSEPVYRRLDENFICAGATPDGIITFRAWRQKA